MQRRISVRPRFFGFIIVVMLLCFTISFLVAQFHYARASERLGALRMEKLDLTNRMTALTDQLSYVQSDAYVERVARDELNMIMPGEIRYVSN